MTPAGHNAVRAADGAAVHLRPWSPRWSSRQPLASPWDDRRHPGGSREAPIAISFPKKNFVGIENNNRNLLIGQRQSVDEGLSPKKIGDLSELEPM